MESRLKSKLAVIPSRRPRVPACWPGLSHALLALCLLCLAPGVSLADADAKQVFIDARCDRCHAVEAAGIAAKKPRAGDLSRAGAEKDADWVRGYLLRKQELAGATHPVAWKGSDAELDALVAWLASLR